MTLSRGFSGWEHVSSNLNDYADMPIDETHLAAFSMGHPENNSEKLTGTA